MESLLLLLLLLALSCVPSWRKKWHRKKTRKRFGLILEKQFFLVKMVLPRGAAAGKLK